MYEVRINKNISDNLCTIYQSVNSKNQIIQMSFMIDDVKLFPEFTIYFVTFQIMSKRKHGFQENVSTGKDGIKSLIWAKNCIKDFIENELYSGDKIVIGASNSKRFRVYQKGLKDLRFYQDRYNNKLSLVYIHK